MFCSRVSFVIYVYIYLSLSLSIYIYICISLSIHIHIYIYMYIYIYTYYLSVVSKLLCLSVLRERRTRAAIAHVALSRVHPRLREWARLLRALPSRIEPWPRDSQCGRFTMLAQTGLAKSSLRILEKSWHTHTQIDPSHTASPHAKNPRTKNLRA